MLIFADNFYIAKLIIDQGANVNQISTKFGTPLHAAVRANVGNILHFYFDRCDFIFYNWKIRSTG